MSVSAPPLSEPSSGLRVRYRRSADLKPASRNPRTHTKKQIRQIANSIQEFGFTNPLLVDKHDRVIAGHGRLEAAKLLQLEQIPTIQLDQLSEHQIRAYVIADNKLAENAGWDRELLALEFQYLTELELDFDVSVMGFETAEIDVLIGELDPGEADADDDVPLPEPGPPITQPGDLWQIGPHRLICGDATHFQTYAQLLGSERAQMVFTDPPYNVPIEGHVSGLGNIRHREFAMAAGEMTEAEFIDFLTRALSQMADFSIDGSIHFVCMDWRHLRELLSATEACYDEFKNLCVWTKTNGGMGSFYRSQHELVFVFKKGRTPHINNIELGKYGRNRTNVWAYAGMSSFGETRDQELSLHPTVKPINLVADAILDCSDRGGIVLDGFAGSGTTLLAAERTGRRGYGVELDAQYCDVTLRRMLAIGQSPIHVASGRKFADLHQEASEDREEEI
jgi:DNA modification methylase